MDYLSALIGVDALCGDPAQVQRGEQQPGHQRAGEDLVLTPLQGRRSASVRNWLTSATTLNTARIKAIPRNGRQRASSPKLAARNRAPIRPRRKRDLRQQPRFQTILSRLGPAASN